MTETPDPDLRGPSSAQVPPRSARFWKRAFVASLAVNLLIAGVVGGALMKGPHPAKGSVRDLGFGAFGAAMDEADRKAMRQAFFEQDGVNPREIRAAIRADHARLLAVLRAEPFDVQAFDAVVAQQQSRARRQAEVGQTVLRERLVAMNTAQRHAFADRLEQSLKRPGGPGDRPPPGEGAGGPRSAGENGAAPH